MNPDKLFDYLEGRLPKGERAALQRQLISDRELQRELAIAREIHAKMHGDSREVFLPAQTDITERSRKMALRVGIGFIVLMAVNVGVGLWIIARHETKNPNRALLETQMREQITKALEHAAIAFTPVPVGVSEITIPAANGALNAVADKVIAISSQFGGSATKGIADQHRLSVLVDLAANRESEFRAAIAAMTSEPRGATTPTTTPIRGAVERKSFVVQVVEASGDTPK